MFNASVGSQLAFNAELSCLHSLPEHELQEESRDLEEEQEAAGRSERRSDYTLTFERFGHKAPEQASHPPLRSSCMNHVNAYSTF